MNKKLLKIVLPLVVIFVATTAGYLWYIKPTPARAKLAQAVKRGDQTFHQYFNADYSTAKTAALDYIRFLDQASAESANPLRNPYRPDAMIWYVRLAKLEEKNHGSEQAGYMREAVARCQKLGSADCSEERLRRDADRTDDIALATLNKE